MVSVDLAPLRPGGEFILLKPDSISCEGFAKRKLLSVLGRLSESAANTESCMVTIIMTRVGYMA